MALWKPEMMHRPVFRCSLAQSYVRRISSAGIVQEQKKAVLGSFNKS